jgi:hypothetical protein
MTPPHRAGRQAIARLARIFGLCLLSLAATRAAADDQIAQVPSSTASQAPRNRPRPQSRAVSTHVVPFPTFAMPEPNIIFNPEDGPSNRLPTLLRGEDRGAPPSAS